MGKAASKESGHENLIAENEYQIRLVTYLNEGADYLRTVLHDPTRGNLPTNETDLYKTLLLFKTNLNNLSADQKQIVFPNNKRTNSKKFDITILCHILINCCPQVKPPVGGWKIKTPKTYDLSEGADIIRLRKARNDVMHARKLTRDQYIELWDTIEAVMIRLGYDVKKVNGLKTGSLNDMELFKIAILKAKVEVHQNEVLQIESEVQLCHENTQQIRDDVDQNHDNIQQNRNNIDQHKVHIYQKRAIIQQNGINIILNKGNIQENRDSIQQNREFIGKNHVNIVQKRAIIQQNGDKINLNKGNIQENRDNILQNRENIGHNHHNIVQKRFIIQKNRDQIDQNRGDIQENRENIEENTDEIQNLRQQQILIQEKLQSLDRKLNVPYSDIRRNHNSNRNLLDSDYHSFCSNNSNHDGYDTDEIWSFPPSNNLNHEEYSDTDESSLSSNNNSNPDGYDTDEIWSLTPSSHSNQDGNDSDEWSLSSSNDYDNNYFGYDDSYDSSMYECYSDCECDIGKVCRYKYFDFDLVDSLELYPGRK